MHSEASVREIGEVVKIKVGVNITEEKKQNKKTHLQLKLIVNIH